MIRLLCLTVVFTVIAVPAALFGQDLVAFYPFSGNTNDMSGNGLDGTLYGAELTTDRFGNPNSAYAFDGVGDYIEVSDNDLFNVTNGGGVTVCLWMKTTDQGSQGLLSKYNSVGQGGYYVGSFEEQIFFDGRDPAYRSSGATNNPADDTWHFVVGRRDNNMWSIWIDGIMESESLNVGSGGSINNAQSLIIGAANDVTGVAGHFAGALDDIRIYNRALTEQEIIVLYDWTPEPSDLVAFYPFSGNTNDMSGNGLDGTLYGAELTTDRFGNPNSAYAFDGVGDYIEVSDNDLFNVTNGGGVTVCLWFKTVNGGNQSPLSKYNSVGAGGYQPGFQGGHVFFDGRDPAYRSSGHANAPLDNCWHFLVGRRDNNMWSIWIDGIMESESLNVGSGGAINNAQPLVIGAANDVNGRSNYFNGALDDIRIYNRALADAEVTLLAGLVAYYPFNGTANDMSGNGLHGTVNGAVLTEDRFGNPNSAYYFDGASSNVQVSDNDLFDAMENEDLTVCAWIKTTDISDWCVLSKYRSYGNRGGYQLSSDGSSVAFGGRDLNGYWYSSTPPNPADGCWHMLVGMRSGTKWSIWVDGLLGSEYDAGSSAQVANDVPLTIGACQDGTFPLNGFFQGSIDDIRIYSRALTACEIYAMYTSPENVFTFTDSTLADWTLFGSPSPIWLASVYGRHGIFDNNSDAQFNNGATSVATFNLNNGFDLKAAVYLDLRNPDGRDAEACVGITNPADVVNLPYVMLDLAHRGANCGASSPDYCSHTYLYGWYLSDCGYVNFGDYYHEADMINADQYVNDWHTLRVVVDSISLLPAFYIDNHLLFLGTAPLAAEVLAEDRSIWIGARSAGDAGKAYHDQVCISQGGSHGLVPQPESLTIQVLGNDVHLSWTPSYTCNTDQISYAVFYETDSEADFEFLALTGSNSYVHEHVVQFESSMYYEIAAYNIPQAQLLSLIGTLGAKPRKTEIDRILIPLGVR